MNSHANAPHHHTAAVQPHISPPPPLRHHIYLRRLTLALLLLWFVVSFVFIFFAQALQNVYLWGWPFLFYLASQGALFVYVFIVVFYAIAARWLEHRAVQGMAKNQDI